MSENKPDRRTIKTRKALRESLAELLTTKELHRITVQEIADGADVNRVTFYKHYLDIYDLYEKLESDLLTDMGLLFLKQNEGSGCMEQLIDYIDENRTVFSMVFSPYVTGALRGKLERMVDGMYLIMFREKYDIPQNDKEFEYLCRYHSAGCMAILGKWVLEGYSHSKESVVKAIDDADRSFTEFCESYFC